MTYRAPEGPAAVTVNRGGVSTGAAVELPACKEWTTVDVQLGEQITERRLDESAGKSRWRGSGALVIDDVRVVGVEDREQSVFNLGDMLTVCVDIAATQSGRFPLIPAALVFRADGVVTTRHVGDEILLDVQEGDRIHGRLDIGPLMIGNGTYLLSIGLYQKLDLADIEPSSVYDYYDRSFEFTVTGSPSLHNEIVRHPGSWRLETAVRPESTPQAARL